MTSLTSPRRWTDLSAAETEQASLVDANLLLWAHHAQFPQHEPARRWWSGLLSSNVPVGIPWPSILAFLRISTHPSALERQLEIGIAWQVVEGWLARPNAFSPLPSERHAPILKHLLVSTRARGNHIPDAHLAALALEWGLLLCSADHDFSCYPGLRWRDPLVGA